MKNKKCLFYGMSLLLVTFIAFVGCNTKPNNPPVKPPVNDAPSIPGLPQPGDPIKEAVKVKSIKIAGIPVSGKASEAAFKEAVNFNKDVCGPYKLAEDPTTAYISFKIDIPTPDGGNDFTINVSNANSYLKPVRHSRQKSGNDKGLFISRANVTLAKGENNILVEITSPEKDVAVYHFQVNYDGGPVDNPSRVLPGVFCPTMRKSLVEGEQEELLWIIFVTGWCPNCPRMLNPAGKMGKGKGKGYNIAERYADQGLRVVGIDCAGDDLAGAFKKWKDSGKGYPFYSPESNCLMKYFGDTNKTGKEQNGIPQGSLVKKGEEICQSIESDFGTDYEAGLIKVFGLKPAPAK